MERNVKSTVKSETKIYNLLSDVHLTEVERWRARSYAARAEYLADLIAAAGRGLRGLVHAIQRTSRLPARTAH
jgi:hypothetical protein